jgi:hypothetical protein
MESTKPVEEARSMVSDSSKNNQPLATKGNSQVTCNHFGEFFQCSKTQNCPSYQDCLRTWMKRVQDSPNI